MAYHDDSGPGQGRSDPGAWLRELPPENPNGFTFHLPLQIQALEIVSAPPEVIAEQIERSLPDAFASGLKDPPKYRWAEAAYRPLAADLLSEDDTTRLQAFASVAPLGEGLAGAAFHGLIRLGYGALRRDQDELARGLAYLRSRRQVLFSLGPWPVVAPPLQPSAKELKGLSIFDQLDLVAGGSGVLQATDSAGPIPSVADLCQQALDLMIARPSSFIAVHAVDALHALVEVQHLVYGPAPVADQGSGVFAGWWRAYLWSLRACGTLVALTPETVSEKPYRRYANFVALTDAAISSCEAHDIKVVVALRRLTELGIIDEAAALDAGSAKLSATECLP